uniref:NADH-ubiquinone oxidoreductase chain 4L n=1 Tax=Calisoga longitarsis TaxID=394809 RepID=B2CKV3_9ARAC|nr:NADH dehydrogenase subunit 4L [Calisoga longitarsis]
MLISSIISISIISILWWRHNIIAMLISLELLLLSCLMAMILSSNSYAILILPFLTIMVSSSTIGLSLLVSISRLSPPSSSLINLTS